MDTKNQKISRFASIDIIRGIALFMNVFVHLFTDIFNLDPITSDGNLFKQPLSILLLFITIGYFGSFGSLYIMISGTGNTVSMYKGIQKEKPIKAVVSKQIVGGLLLIIFSFLVEGVLQFYGFLGTINAANGHEFDPTRAIWHAYVMTPVLCLACAMVITGIIQFFLFQNDGHKKHRRNIFVYIVLSVLVITLSQVVWNICKQYGPAGFPNAGWGDGAPGDHKVFMPPPGASIGELVTHFFLTLGGGSNHPLFPFLAVSFVGNIFGILLVAAEEQKTMGQIPNIHTPRYCVYGAMFVFLTGVVLIPIIGVDFDSILPVNAIGDITLIHDGLDGFWIPWFCFLFAGEILFLAIFIRLIEYRGMGTQKANKTPFLRRFGMPAFSVYAWHRFWAIPAVVLISYLAGAPSWESGSITGTSLGWGWTILAILLSWFLIHYILKLWEKVGFIGGVEWMMGTVAGALGKNMRKTKGSQKENPKWWELGKMDMEAIFYNVDWIDIFSRDENYKENLRDSKLAKKFSIIGLILWPISIIAYSLSRTSIRFEGMNDINKKAKLFSLIGLVLLIVAIIGLSLISLETFNITF
jgi:hypothetical protein